MKILITNDDSYMSVSVHYLADYFTKLGHEVTLIVPMYEQSGISMSVNVNRPFNYQKVNDHYYIIASTPADCVRFGVYGLKNTYDLVISGINHGLNLGDDLYYSGTCGAIYEAGRIGLKGIALSTNMASFNDSYEALPMVLDFIKEHNLLDIHPMWNVNIPMHNSHKIVYATFGDKHYDCSFEIKDDTLIERRDKHPELEPEGISDVYELEHNRNITVSPLSLTRIDNNLIEKLRAKK